MADSTISKFKSTLIGGGARPNLFEVSIGGNIPGGGTLGETFNILCKAAQLPASNIASIDVPYRGRIFKVAGDRTFDPWTVTIINDEDFRIRKVMENWMQFIGQYGDASGATNPNDYMVDAEVKQLKRGAQSGTPITGSNALTTAHTYKFYSIFPTNISAIDLSYDSSDTIEEFTVEFQVQYWSPISNSK